MTYEELLIEADNEGIITKEKALKASEGRIIGKKIAIKKDLTETQKACALAEELGHYHTSVGDILNLSDVRNRQQERRARLWAYNKQIGLSGIIAAYKAHCQDRFETAAYLNVSEEFLDEALDCYHEVYGHGQMVDNYFVQFEPNLQVYEYFTI